MPDPRLSPEDARYVEAAETHHAGFPCPDCGKGDWVAQDINQKFVTLICNSCRQRTTRVFLNELDDPEMMMAWEEQKQEVIQGYGALPDDIESVTAELSDIADQLDQMGEVFKSDWPVKLSDRVRAVALQVIDMSGLEEQ